MDFTLRIAGLPAGTYTWISNHHDGRVKGNQEGFIRYSLKCSDSQHTAEIFQTAAIEANDSPSKLTIESFQTDGSDFVFNITADNADIEFAIINSLEIVSIPETRAFALILGSSALALAASRRPKRATN